MKQILITVVDGSHYILNENLGEANVNATTVSPSDADGNASPKEDGSGAGAEPLTAHGPHSDFHDVEDDGYFEGDVNVPQCIVIVGTINTAGMPRSQTLVPTSGVRSGGLRNDGDPAASGVDEAIATLASIEISPTDSTAFGTSTE